MILKDTTTLKDRELMMLHVAGARMFYLMGKKENDSISLDELAKIKSGDVVLPTKGKDGCPGPTTRLRCVREPDEAQKVLLHRLGVTLPRRLRRIDQAAEL